MSNYDAIYTKVAHPYGGGKPDQLIRLLAELVPQGLAVDLGAGDGRHAIALARDGWRVIAVDTSEVGLAKLEAYAKELNQPKIQTVHADIAAWEPDQEIDAMVVAFVLHHLTNVQAKAMFTRMQKKTRSGGLHAIATFTPAGDFYREHPNEEWFYPTKEELLDLYKGWEVIFLQEEEGLARQKKADGTAMKNTILRLLVRK
jgi:SAM-dependent methyltransferase